MVKARLMVPALLLLVSGFVLLLDTSASITAYMGLAVPGIGRIFYFGMIMVGVVLTVVTLRTAYEEPDHVAPQLHATRSQKSPPTLEEIEEMESKRAGKTKPRMEDGFLFVGENYVDEDFKPIVQQMTIRSRSDIEAVQGVLRQGPRMVMMDISAITHKPAELKKWLKILEHTVRARNGNLAGLERKWLVATSEMPVQRAKSLKRSEDKI